MNICGFEGHICNDRSTFTLTSLSSLRLFFSPIFQFINFRDLIFVLLGVYICSRCVLNEYMWV